MAEPDTLEAIIWCRHCEVEKYRVYRRPMEGREGVYENVREPDLGKEKSHRCDVCGNLLERI